MTHEERKGRGRGAIDAAAAGIEEKLRSLVPAAVPRGLRERVLDRAAEARRGAVLAPWMRVAAGACAAVIAIVLVIDPLLSRHEDARMAALLDGRPEAAGGLEAVPPELADVGDGQGTAAGRWARHWVLTAAAKRGPSERSSFESLEQLKGWLEYETSQDPY